MLSHAFSDMSHNGIEVLATYKKARAEYENRDAPPKEEWNTKNTFKNQIYIIII